MGGDELHAALGRGKDDGGIASETGGGCETQDARAGFCVVDAGKKAIRWRHGGKQEITLTEQLLVLAAESSVALAERVNFGLAEGRAPCETSSDGGVEFVKKAGMELRGFVGLEWGVDVPGFGPERWVEGIELCVGAAEAVLPDFQSVVDIGLAGFEEGPGENADADCLRGGIFRWQIEEGFGEERQIAEIATEPADGVEGLRQVVAAGPVADAEGGAVAREPAQRGRSAHGASGVGADGGERRAFLNGSGRAAGGAAGEEAGVGRLQAVAVVAIFAGDAVGELMEVGFADYDGARTAQAGGDPGILGCVLFMGRIKFGAGACRESGEVETILERDRHAKKRQEFVARGGAVDLSLGFGKGPVGVKGQVDIAAGIAVGA